jgi:AcrR family transcriptional regulator
MIAGEAGVAVGSIYGYFADKRAILLELMDTTMRQEADEVIAHLDPTSWQGSDDPRAWARSLIDAVFHTTRLRPGLSRILWERYFKDPQFAEPFEALRTRLIDAIALFIRAVDDEGLCKPIGDPNRAAFVVLNAVQWNATQAIFVGDAKLVDAAALETAEMISRYLFVED